MKQTVYYADFERAFSDYGRRDNFSYQGLKQLFQYIEDLEEDIGEEIELDVIALCCDFWQLDLDQFCGEYDVDLESDDIRDDVQARLEEEGVWFEFVYDTYPRQGEPHWTVIFQCF